MVFTGWPSTACLLCRQRRLRCDRAPTGCSPCKRKGTKCSGYRDPSALRIRDETSRTTRKFGTPPSAKKTTASHTQAQVQLVLHVREQESRTHRAVEHPTRPASQLTNFHLLLGDASYPLQQNVHDTSMAYFLRCYLQATPFQRYVPSFCLADADAQDACSIAISATALAAYARRARSAKYLDHARHQYAEALARVNELLSSPETAVLDRTLVSVLVLGLFEAIVFEAGKSPTSWTAHTLGAMQLLRLRGPQQFKSFICRKMFAHASNNIKTSCIQRSIPVPDDFVAFDKQLTLVHDPNDASVRLSPLVQQIASIKARAVADPDCNLVHEALELDRAIIAFAEACPACMSYTVEATSHASAWVYRGICHRYPSAYMAKFWNTVRLLRMFLVVLIRGIAAGQVDANLCRLCLPHGKTSVGDYLSELRQYAGENMETITMEVLASIPSFVEADGFGRRFAPAARSLAWPLSIIENTDMCGEAAREHAYRTLEMLAGDLNMPQAVHPSRFPGIREDWMHLFHLG